MSIWQLPLKAAIGTYQDNLRVIFLKTPQRQGKDCYRGFPLHEKSPAVGEPQYRRFPQIIQLNWGNITLSRPWEFTEQGLYQLMLFKSAASRNPHSARKLPLRLVLVVPFVLQIFAAVGLTGYLSFRHGQKAINHLATQLRTKVSDLVDQHLNTYRLCCENFRK